MALNAHSIPPLLSVCIVCISNSHSFGHRTRTESLALFSCSGYCVVLPNSKSMADFRLSSRLRRSTFPTLFLFAPPGHAGRLVEVYSVAISVIRWITCGRFWQHIQIRCSLILEGTTFVCRLAISSFETMARLLNGTSMLLHISSD